MKPQRPLLLSLLASTAGGVLGWFVYLLALKFTVSAFSSTLIEPARVGSIFLQVFLTALALFVACGVLIAALSPQRWLIHWLAFVVGILICITMRFHPQGFELTIEVFFRAALVCAVLSSGIAAHLSSRYWGRGIRGSRAR